MRYKLTFSFLMSFLISGAISLFFTMKNNGLQGDFLSNWIIGGWIYAFPIAFVMALFLPSILNKFLKKIDIYKT